MRYAKDNRTKQDVDAEDVRGGARPRWRTTRSCQRCGNSVCSICRSSQPSGSGHFTPAAQAAHMYSWTPERRGRQETDGRQDRVLEHKSVRRSNRSRLYNDSVSLNFMASSAVRRADRIALPESDSMPPARALRAIQFGGCGKMADRSPGNPSGISNAAT